MKTAMQEHIEHLKIMQKMVKEKLIDSELTKTINETLSGAIENAESFIEAEQKQIIGAHMQGQWFKSPRANLEEDDNYYDKNFK